MADITFPTLDPEATDSALINIQKKAVGWRAVQAAAALFDGGGGGGIPAGAEYDTDSNAPVFDTDSSQVVVSTDS